MILNTGYGKRAKRRLYRAADGTKIKHMHRVAYGFRRIKNMIDMIMLMCSDIEVELPYKVKRLAKTF